eukprot:TRINITY_DN4031_c1_g1_i1.p1 TRINITY_DN4031_c1_g1~~TRINITY_DN4031_c1_g1_i1.p1  ORF type:complete len:658 (+),score=96.63 TRINITY_DN4031_c1_g1_i1:69-2042(+)
MESFSADTVAMVLRFLSYTDICSCASVSKLWHTAVNLERLWYLLYIDTWDITPGDVDFSKTTWKELYIRKLKWFPAKNLDVSLTKLWTGTQVIYGMAATKEALVVCYQDRSLSVYDSVNGSTLFSDFTLPLTTTEMHQHSVAVWESTTKSKIVCVLGGTVLVFVRFNSNWSNPVLFKHGKTQNQNFNTGTIQGNYYYTKALNSFYKFDLEELDSKLDSSLVTNAKPLLESPIKLHAFYTHNTGTVVATVPREGDISTLHLYPPDDKDCQKSVIKKADILDIPNKISHVCFGEKYFIVISQTHDEVPRYNYNQPATDSPVSPYRIFLYSERKGKLEKVHDVEVVIDFPRITKCWIDDKKDELMIFTRNTLVIKSLPILEDIKKIPLFQKKSVSPYFAAGVSEFESCEGIIVLSEEGYLSFCELKDGIIFREFYGVQGTPFFLKIFPTKLVTGCKDFSFVIWRFGIQPTALISEASAILLDKLIDIKSPLDVFAAHQLTQQIIKEIPITSKECLRSFAATLVDVVIKNNVNLANITTLLSQLQRILPIFLVSPQKSYISSPSQLIPYMNFQDYFNAVLVDKFKEDPVGIAKILVPIYKTQFFTHEFMSKCLTHLEKSKHRQEVIKYFQATVDQFLLIGCRRQWEDYTDTDAIDKKCNIQ